MSSLSPTQFDDDRIATALSVPADVRRRALFTARKQAARRNATQWALGVQHSSHEGLSEGNLRVSESRVLMSRAAYPDAIDAEQDAYVMGHARGTYPTRVRHV